MPILDAFDLKYNGTVKEFERSVKQLVINWSNRDNYDDPYETIVNEMLFWAARAGNLPVVKLLMKEHNADPNFKRNGKSDVLSNCIQSGVGIPGISSFRDVSIYLIDNGAIPNIDDNAPLKAAKKSSISMILGDGGYGNLKDKHDKVVLRLLQEQSVIETIINKQQKEFYELIPEIVDVFMF